MNFFKLLQDQSKGFLFFLIFLGLIDSVWIATLLAFVDNKVGNKPFPIPIAEGYDGYLYFSAMVLSLLTSWYFQTHMIKLTLKLGNKLAVSVFDKLRFANYSEFKELGQDRVRTLMSDVGTIQTFPSAFVELFKAVITTLIAVLYMIYINYVSAIIICSVIIIVIIVFIIKTIQIMKDFDTLRDFQNVNEQHVNNYLRGFKELKTSISRSNNIFGSLKSIKDKMRDFGISVFSRFVVYELFATQALYVIIGLLLFVIPNFTMLSSGDLATYIMILMFISGPIDIIMAQGETITQMNVALKRINEFEEIINVSPAVKIGHGDLTNINETFENIRFDNVVFEYLDASKNPVFTLGPINLTISKGECIFIKGSNGSGKSTFINLLTGLYLPTSGNIYLNGFKITPENYPNYRDQIASIFTDTYLFDQNYNDFDIEKDNSDVKSLLNKMKISDIVKIDEEKKIFDMNLSKGQQKRVALIYSLLEGKDIIVLDEWAAEQDPEFRRYFYQEIVKSMTDSGKTIIAVTHDDEYFDCAGRLIEFKYGKVHDDKYLNS